MELLTVKNLKKIYNQRRGMQPCPALSGISFSVQEGEFTAVMGPSGSGKSTLLNILAALDSPSSGEVLLDGRSFADIPEKQKAEYRRNHLGFVFQDFHLLDTFTLKDNILLPLVLSRTSIAEMEQKLYPVTDMLGISRLLDKYPYEVSGGEKQRTAIARAVITDPRILLADEPTGALDSKASAKLLQSFRELNEHGKTILMVTHSAMAASWADRVLFISDGMLFSQLYRGEDDNRAFFDRIVNNLSLVGGADVG